MDGAKYISEATGEKSANREDGWNDYPARFPHNLPLSRLQNATRFFLSIAGYCCACSFI
jgi:hypothetical protein